MATMDTKRPGLLSTCARSFLGVFFGLLGLVAGVIVIVIVFGLFSLGSEDKHSGPGAGRYNVLPNADGTLTSLAYDSPLILTLNISGLIGGESLNTESIRDQLERSRLGPFRKDRIKGILLTINSPGGTVFDSSAIYRLLEDYKKHYKVPVFGYIEGLCASGGMFIGSAADQLYASDVSLIGSVGVMASFVNVAGTLNKIGMEALVLSKGKDKTLLNPLKPWEEGDTREMHRILNYYYDQFVDVVLKGRPKLSREALVTEYGARVFPAPIAAEYGYIDGVVEGRADVILRLAHKLNIADEGYQVVELEEKSLFDKIFSGPYGILSGKVEHHLRFPGVEELPPSGFLYLYQVKQTHT